MEYVSIPTYELPYTEYGEESVMYIVRHVPAKRRP